MSTREPHELDREYPRGLLVTGTVSTLLPYGAEVHLGNEVCGIIRNRELRWGREPRHPREVLTVGQSVKALVLKVDQERQRLELSLRQGERDPWTDIHDRFHPGQVVSGQVVRLSRYGAFIELEPGLHGLVPICEITPEPIHSVDDVLWVGDSVEATLTALDVAAREIHLSILARMTLADDHESDRLMGPGSEAHRTTLSDALREEDRDQLMRVLQSGETNTSRDPGLEAPRPTATRTVKTILIVDNDADFRHSLAQMLQRFGYDAVALKDAPSAAKAMDSREFDVLLVDLDLGHGGRDSLILIESLLQRPSPPRTILMTGMPWSEHVTALLEEAKQLGVKAVAFKPLDLADLEKIMESVAAGEDVWPLEVAAGVRPFRDTEAALAKGIMGSTHPPDPAATSLSDLHASTEASVSVLFQVSPDHGQLRIVAHIGNIPRSYEEEKHNLQASPVHDVVCRGRVILESDAAGKHLYRNLRFIEFRSCIGVPVPSPQVGEYGILLFHPRPHHFSSLHLAQARATATAIGADVLRVQLERLLRRVQPILVMGQTGMSMVHELNNTLGSVVSHAQVLAADRDLLEKSPSRILDPEVRARISACVETIARLAATMRALSQVYVQSIRTEQIVSTNVNDVVIRVQEYLKQFAESGGVTVRVLSSPDMPSTACIPVRLEQACVNVVLNAIQHLQLIGKNGYVQIATAFDPADSGFPIKVRISDNGLGIHASHQSRLFEMGFSTRPEGTGLGLFVAKRLVESMKGRIRVERSVILLGTVFVIELPLVVLVGQGAD